MRPHLYGTGCFLALFACVATPLSAPSSSTEPRKVPLRDTSGEAVLDEPEQPPTSPSERWRARTVEQAPAPRAHGRLIDLDVRGADIQDVCRLLADVGQANIVVSDEVHGTVTVRMKNVPWDQALEVIAEAKGLRTVREGEVILVKAAGK